MKSGGTAGEVQGGLAAAAGGLAAQLLRVSSRERRVVRTLTDLARVTSRKADARQEICDAALELLGSDADALLLPADGELVSDTTSGVELPPLRVAADDPESPVARAFREQRLQFLRGRRALERAGFGHTGARAVLAVPVTRVGVRLGVCMWLWRRRRRRPSRRERELAVLLGDEKGMTIQQQEVFLHAVDVARTQVRTRIARDLHDSVAQELAMLRVYASTAAKALDGRPEVLAEVIPQLEVHAAKAEREMRALLDALRDDRAVVDLGIADVVDAVVNDFRQRCRDVDLQVEIPGREGFEPRPAVRETVYYVLREALHNAARHARASSISVRTRAEPEAVTLEVEDDGRGFDADAREHGHHGLQGMRERAELAGGELEVSSMPGSGTKVSLRIDHPRADDALVTEVP